MSGGCRRTAGNTVGLLETPATKARGARTTKDSGCAKALDLADQRSPALGSSGAPDGLVGEELLALCAAVCVVVETLGQGVTGRRRHVWVFGRASTSAKSRSKALRHALRCPSPVISGALSVRQSEPACQIHSALQSRLLGYLRPTHGHVAAGTSRRARGASNVRRRCGASTKVWY